MLLLSLRFDVIIYVFDIYIAKYNWFLAKYWTNTFHYRK